MRSLHPFKQANYFVEEKGFFSTTQCLLHVSADKGLKRSLFNEPLTVLNRISWDQLLRVTPSANNHTEFFIVYDADAFSTQPNGGAPSEENHATLGESQFRMNTPENETEEGNIQQIRLRCSERHARNSLVCQLQCLIDERKMKSHNGAVQQIKCLYWTDGTTAVHSEESEGSLVLLNTAIQIQHRNPAQARIADKIIPATFTPSPRQQQETSGNAINDHRQFAEEGIMFNSYQQTNLLMSDNDEITPRYTTESADGNDNYPMKSFEMKTPQRLGATRDTKGVVSTILICDIAQLIYIDKKLIIVMKSQEIDWIILDSEQQVVQLIEQIRQKTKKLFPLESFKPDVSQLQQNDRWQNEIDFMKFPDSSAQSQTQKRIFMIKADTYCENFSAMKQGQSILMDEHTLYELDDQHSIHPVKQAKFEQLQLIQLVNNEKNFNLVLEFSLGVKFCIKVENFVDRERIVSSLLTLRAFLFEDENSDYDLVKVLQNKPLDSGSKINGYEPVFNRSGFNEKMTFQYEIALLDKLYREKDSEKKRDINLEKIINNCNFFSISEMRTGNPSHPIDVLSQIIQEYLEMEETQFEAIENILINNSGCRASRKDLFCHFGGQSEASFTRDSFANQFGNRTSFAGLIQKEETKKMFGSFTKSHSANQFAINQEMTTQQKQAIQQYEEDELHQEMEFDKADSEADKARAQAIKKTEVVVRALNILKSLLNSSVFFAEVSQHTQLFSNLTTLLMSKNSLVALLSGQVIKAIFHHRGAFNIPSIERENKIKLLKGQDLLSKIIDYMTEFEQSLAQNQKVFSMHFKGIYLILNSILKERVSTTPVEVLEAFYNELNQPDQRSQMVGMQQFNTQTKISLIEKFSLCHAALLTAPVEEYQDCMSPSRRVSRLTNYPKIKEDEAMLVCNEDYFDVQYLFSVILCQNVKFVSSQAQKNNKMKTNVFDFLLEKTILFIWHLHLQIRTELKRQKDISINILAMMLINHPSCPDLLSRILPCSLMAKYVENNRYDGAQNWINFFKNQFCSDLDNAREQWGRKMRNELARKLAEEIRQFMRQRHQSQKQELAKRSEINSSYHRQSHVGSNHGGLDAGASSEFNNAIVLSSQSKPVKWNYTEFEVYYDSLAKNYLVDGYYLKNLLELEATSPEFTAEVKYPGSFWDALQVTFMASEDADEQCQILMTLCHLYKTKFVEIGKIKSLGYWLRLIEKEDYAHCQFLLLQLVHIALSVQGKKQKEMKLNMQKFIKEKGFLILHNCMNLVFKELPDAQVDNSAVNRQLWTNFLKVSKIENQQDETVNFTVNKTHSMYFRRNSKNVSLAILSLKIFDLIFTDMHFIDSIPQSSNRKYLLQEHSLATMTQTIMLENGDLTREVLIFIEKHLSDHYTFYKMRELGMIEFLILCLATRNNFRALKLLKIFQQVCFQFNQQLKLGGELAANDLKMILEDKQKREKEEKEEKEQKESSLLTPTNRGKIETENARPPLLGDSIFLRYLPVPFIKYLYERNDQKFLEIYRRHDYRHPLLIWSSDMRKTLEDKIKNNAKEFLSDLRIFANDPTKFRTPSEIPVFYRQVREIVKYKQIEEEVRCGRYYLGVWTSLESKFMIKQEQEQEFHQKMQAELRYCIYEENLSQPDKIITHFKMCLLALKRFKSSRITALNEIKRILLAICKPKSFENIEQNFATDKRNGHESTSANHESSQSAAEGLNSAQEGISPTGQAKHEKAKPRFPYNQKTQELLYIGTKIFHEAIMKDDTNNKTEILTMNGVELMSSIVSFILENTFETPQQIKKSIKLKREVNKTQMSVIHERFDDSMVLDSSKIEHEIPAKEQEYESHQEINIKAIDAETLLLSMQSIHKLLEEDTQSFIDIRLEQRIEIFTQMTQILNLSFKLYDLIEDRSLKSQPSNNQRGKLQNSGTQNSYMKTSRQMIDDQHNTTSIQNQTDSEIGPASKRRKKTRRQTAQKGTKRDKQNDKDLNYEKEDGKDEEAFRKEFEGMPRSQAQTYEKQTLLQILQHCKDKRTDSNKQHLNKQQKRENREKEKYVVDLILNIAESIFAMMAHITYRPQLHPELIASGLVWQAIRHSYFDLKEYFDLSSRDGLTLKKSTKEQYKKLKQILEKSTNSVILMVSFAEQFNTYGEEMQFKNLTKKQEKGIMKNFYDCIQKIFTKRMQEDLKCKFSVNNENKLVTQGEISSQPFLSLFSMESYNSHELIWNSITRKELLDILQRQIDCLIAEEAISKQELEQAPFSARSRNASVDLSEQQQDGQMLLSSHRNNNQLMTLEKFCNILSGFEYSVNQQELLIDDIYVNYFNQPELTEPKVVQLTSEKKESFAKAIIERLKDLHQQPSQHQISMISDLPARENDTTKLVQAFCRLMVEFDLQVQGEEKFQDYFETLCSLINLDNDENSASQHQIVKCVLKIIRQIIMKKRMRVDQHLVRDERYLPALDSEQDHCQFLLGTENMPLLKLLMDVLEQRGTSASCIELKQAVIGILNDVIKIKEYEYVETLFTQQGILVFLLKILFNPEEILIENQFLEANQKMDLGIRSIMPVGLIPSFKQVNQNTEQEDMPIMEVVRFSRQTLLDIILKVESEELTAFKQGKDLNQGEMDNPKGVLKAFLPQNFLLEILDKMSEDIIDNQDMIDTMQKNWLVDFDQLTFQSVFVHWNQELRQQSKEIVSEQCEIIRAGIVSNYNSQRDRLVNLKAIEDPKLKEEERIDELIMLRIYNKNPNVYIKMQLEEFIIKIVDRLELVQQDLYRLKTSEEVTSFSKAIDFTGDPSDPQQSQKRFHYVCHQAKLLLTALLLSIEQLQNDFNPNVKNFRRDQHLQLQAFMIYKQINSKVFQSMKVWLQSPVFIDAHIPTEIRITFLQILYLVVSAKDALINLKGETLNNFITDMIAQIANRKGETPSEETKEESKSSAAQDSTSGYIKLQDQLILMTVEQLLFRDDVDRKIVQCLCTDQSIQNLVKIAKQNRNTLAIDVSYIHAKIVHEKKNFNAELHKKFGELVPMVSRDITEHEDNMKKGDMWRQRPTQSGSKDYMYHQEKSLENFINSNKDLDEGTFPVISQKSVTKYNQEFRPNSEISDLSDNQSRSRSQLDDNSHLN